jgi:hypothetical protein
VGPCGRRGYWFSRGVEVGGGTAETRGVQRAIALVTVVGLHGLTITLMVALRNGPRLSAQTEFVSTVVLLSALPPPAGTSTQRPATANDVAPFEPVESPIAVLPEISAPADTRTGADWASDARRAAAAVPVTSNVRAFGESPKRESARTGAHRCQLMNRVSSIGRRRVPGLSGSAIAAISSLTFPLWDYRRFWLALSPHGRYVRAIRRLRATSRTCRRTRSTTRVSLDAEVTLRT